MKFDERIYLAHASVMSSTMFSIFEMAMQFLSGSSTQSFSFPAKGLQCLDECINEPNDLNVFRKPVRYRKNRRPFASISKPKKGKNGRRVECRHRPLYIIQPMILRT